MNDNYEYIRKKLERSASNTKFCYVQGPTGPKGDMGSPGIQGLPGEKGERGEQGPAGPIGPTGPKGENGPTTINVGTTETVDSDIDAQVTNVGTEKDVILNFKIPKGIPGEKGEQGNQGEQGPRGLPGEIGRSEIITIDETITVESSEQAEVQDDKEGLIHHLTFYIPKGEKGEQGIPGTQGEQGPKGDAGGITAYGERYSNTNQQFHVLANTDTIIPLEQTGPSLAVTYDSSYTIEINESGIYLISYFLNVAPSVDTNYVVSVEVMGSKVASSSIKVEGKANSINNVSSSIFLNLVEFDEINLAITPEQDADLIFDGTTNARLSIMKLG